jgi:hypothetical protein
MITRRLAKRRHRHFLGTTSNTLPCVQQRGLPECGHGANARDGARWRSGDLSGDGGRTRRCSWPDTSEKISMRRSPENHFEKFGEDGEEANKNKNKAALPLPPGGSTAPLGAPAAISSDRPVAHARQQRAASQRKTSGRGMLTSQAKVFVTHAETSETS